MENISFKWNLGNLLDSFKELLILKNKLYGDAALKPSKTFSKESSSNSIATRIDDKISRIKNSAEVRKDDVVDLTGYLLLYIMDKGWEFGDEIEKLKKEAGVKTKETNPYKESYILDNEYVLKEVKTIDDIIDQFFTNTSSTYKIEDD
jgi:hypothetical protein